MVGERPLLFHILIFRPLKVFNELIDFCFEGGNWKFVSVDGHVAKWAKERRSGVAVFAKSTLKKAVKYLLQNCFCKLGNRIFRQLIGIPMEPDPAPFFANLFPHYYETRWIRQLRKSDRVATNLEDLENYEKSIFN